MNEIEISKFPFDINNMQAILQNMAEENLSKEKWNDKYIRTTKFEQDIFGIPELDIAPTHNWTCRLYAQRKDGEFFQTSISEPNIDIVEGNLNMAAIFEDFENMISSLQDFEDCNCGVGRVCDRPYHGNNIIEEEEKQNAA